MGVFDRFRRKSRDVVEAPAEEAPTSTAQGVEAGASADAEGAEIPKQQSVEEAADNEAGDSARK
ncbi:hypothetical protein [Streptomyces hypolithicus]